MSMFNFLLVRYCMTVSLDQDSNVCFPFHYGHTGKATFNWSILLSWSFWPVPASWNLVLFLSSFFLKWRNYIKNSTRLQELHDSQYKARLNESKAQHKLYMLREMNKKKLCLTPAREMCRRLCERFWERERII